MHEGEREALAKLFHLVPPPFEKIALGVDGRQRFQIRSRLKVVETMWRPSADPHLELNAVGRTAEAFRGGEVSGTFIE